MSHKILCRNKNLAQDSVSPFPLQCLRRRPAPPVGTLRWAPFLPDEKWGKESPKAGPSPALWNPPRGTRCPCVFLFSALSPVGSHRWLAVLWFGFTSLLVCTSIARAFPWCAAVPSYRGPGIRRRERRLARVGPDMETAQP